MRQHSRLTFRHVKRVEITELPSGDFLGVVGDFSIGGLRLVGSQPLEVGASYRLCLHVPAHNERIREINVAVICQWSRKGTRPGTWENGFALESPSPAFTAMVAEQAPRRRR